MPTPHHPPSAVRRALASLGANIRLARQRRGLTMALVADRAFTSRVTLQRIEEGDAGVSIGIYASVLHALGLMENLAELANPVKDTVGITLEEASRPKRIRMKRSSSG